MFNQASFVLFVLIYRGTIDTGTKIILFPRGLIDLTAEAERQKDTKRTGPKVWRPHPEYDAHPKHDGGSRQK